MQPAVRRLQDTYGDTVTFQIIDAESEVGSAWFTQLALPGHPGYLIFDTDGREVFRTFGVVEDDELEIPLQVLLAE